MLPKLVVLGGPLKGRRFPIDQQRICIGRATSNDICVNDATASREHCVLENHEGAWRVRDLGSENQTLVNGVAVQERALQHSDRIKVGKSVFLFALEETEFSLPPEAVAFEETSLGESATVAIPEQKSTRAGSDTQRAARELSVLLKLTLGISSVRNEDALYWQLLGMLFEIIPAERGAIVLVSGEPPQFDPVAVWNRGPGEISAVRVSQTVLRRVWDQRAGIIIRDVPQHKTTRTATSLWEMGVRSVVCVPLLSRGNAVSGAIYLDTCNPLVPFSDQHLELLTAIAALACLARENIRHTERLEFENRILRENLGIQFGLVGESAAMRHVRDFIHKVAGTDSTVLLWGESGTGKELAARAIHDNSPRSEASFIAVNCAALSEGLLESELFGHEKGSFTSAYAQKRGHIEIADGGTLFLDEIAELAPGLQAKLLRVLQEREFVRVGGTTPIKVDIRLIAATNRNLAEEVRSARFRQDLYYRLNVVNIRMPNLRERAEDVPLLIELFLVKCSARCKRRVRGISEDAKRVLASYDWPGNVRELENTIERAIVLGSEDFIQVADLPESVLETSPSGGETTSGQYREAVMAFKRQLVAEALAKAGGSPTGAAAILGLQPNYLHRLMRNLALRPAPKAS